MAITFKEFLLFVENVEENFDEWLESIKSYAKPNEQELKKIELGDAQKMLIIKALKDAKKENQDYMKFLMGVMASKPAALSEDLDSALTILKNALNNVNPDTGSPYLTKKEITRDGWFNVGKTTLTDLNAKMTRPESKRQVELAKKRGGFFKGADVVYDNNGIKVYHIPPLGDKATEKELEERHKLYCSIGKDTQWCTAQPTWDAYKSYVKNNIYVIHENGVPKYQYVDIRDNERRQFMDAKDKKVKFLPQEIYDVLFNTDLVNTVKAPGSLGRKYNITPIISVEQYKNLTDEGKMEFLKKLLAQDEDSMLILDKYLESFEDSDLVLRAAQKAGWVPDRVRIFMLTQMLADRNYDAILQNLNSEKVIEALPEALQLSYSRGSGAEQMYLHDRDAILKMLNAILHYMKNNPAVKNTRKVDPDAVAEAAAGFYKKSDFEIFDLLATMYSIAQGMQLRSDWYRVASGRKSSPQGEEDSFDPTDKKQIFKNPNFFEKVKHAPFHYLMQHEDVGHLNTKILKYLADNDVLPRDESTEKENHKIYSFVYDRGTGRDFYDQMKGTNDSRKQNANALHKMGYDLLASATKSGDLGIMKDLLDKLAPSAVEQFLIDAQLWLKQSDVKPEVIDFINKEFSNRKLKHQAASQSLLDFISANKTGAWGTLPVADVPDEKISSMVDKMIADGNKFEDFGSILSKITNGYRERSEMFADPRHYPIFNMTEKQKKSFESFLDNSLVQDTLNKIWPVYKEAQEKSTDSRGMRASAEYAKGRIDATLANLEKAYMASTVGGGYRNISPEAYAEHKKQFENRNLIKGLTKLKNNLDEVPNVYDIERPPVKPSRYDYD